MNSVASRRFTTLLGIFAALSLSACDKTEKRDLLFPASMEKGTVTEEAALDIARRAVATNDPGVTRAAYKAQKNGAGWWVLALLYEIDKAGHFEPQAGSIRSVYISDRGAVTSYLRSK
jgi:hypothetical protein